jgi:uncharacterized membrane protein
MIGASLVYRLAGVLVLVVALLDLRDRSNGKRISTALFWGAYALTLIFGSELPDVVNGLLVVVIVLVGGLGGMGRGAAKTTSDDARRTSAARHGNLLFVPALLVPALTLAATPLLRSARVGQVLLVDPKNASVVGLAASSLVALSFALALLRQPPSSSALEARRLMNLVGWAAVLPQVLAALGAILASAGVGERVAELLGRVVPLDDRLAVVCAYTLGMALFTMLLGNAFAAFPVMMAALGVPLLVRRFHGDPAAVAALGMLSGFCGTLMTPMAANFNVVPASLLELPDEHAVVRVQVPTALVILAANTVLLYVLAFRK